MRHVSALGCAIVCFCVCGALWAQGPEKSAGDASLSPPPHVPSVVHQEKPSPDSRKKVPDDQSQATALKDLKGKYKSAYRAKSEPLQLTLAAQLICDARKAEENPPQQYVMFSEAASLAGRQGDCLLGLLAIDEMGKHLAIATGARKRELVTLAAKQARTLTAVQDIVEMSLKQAEAASSDEEFDAWCELIRKLPQPLGKVLLDAVRSLERQVREIEQPLQQLQQKAQTMPQQAAVGKSKARRQLTDQTKKMEEQAEKVAAQVQRLKNQEMRLKEYAGKSSRGGRRTAEPSLKQVLEAKLARLDELRLWQKQADDAEKKCRETPEDPLANLLRGRFCCLGRQEWEQGLAMLAKGNSGAFSAAAARVVAQPGDTAASLALADAWWSLSEKKSLTASQGALYREAAFHWYEEASPGLSEKDFQKVEPRLIPPGAEAAHREPFSVPLHGLAGMTFMTPQSVKGKVAAGEGFAVIQGGKVDIEYPRVPAMCYVFDLEVKPLGAGGWARFSLGDITEVLNVGLEWSKDAGQYECRLTHCVPGGSWGVDPHLYASGQSLNLKLFLIPCRAELFENDTRIFSNGAGPAELKFRVAADNILLNIQRCEFRPWTRADSLHRKWPVPPATIDADSSETALRLHQRNLNLSDDPKTCGEKAFVVPTTGTAMQWVRPGTVDRVTGGDAANKAKVSISRGFWMAQYETTQAEWLRLMPSNPSHVTGSLFLPVDSVSWDDVARYCTLLNQQESRLKRLPLKCLYRLPTEFEWEYACRAGTSGDFAVDTGGFWCAENSQGRPHEVGEGLPNAWNLYDMHGNVQEWCLDGWHDDPDIRVADPFNPHLKPNEYFVVRGGAWWMGRGACTSRSRDRWRNEPGGYRGFRIVLAPAR